MRDKEKEGVRKNEGKKRSIMKKEAEVKMMRARKMRWMEIGSAK